MMAVGTEIIEFLIRLRKLPQLGHFADRTRFSPLQYSMASDV
jgi:hypothetical protein